MKAAALLVTAAAIANGDVARASAGSPVPVPKGNAPRDYGARTSYSWQSGKFMGINQRQRRKRARQTGRR